jgi:hypothetical protein
MAPLPNSLPETKSEYVRTLIEGRSFTRVSALDVAFAFYHCEVPLEEAKKYMDNLYRKLQS